MNPYNNNPFDTDSKELKNERDANRELAKNAKRNDLNETLCDMFRPMTKDELGFWK